MEDEQDDRSDDLEEEEEEVESEETYSEDDLEQYAHAVEGYLSRCANGQPYDGGEPVWLDSHMTLDEVMDLADVPEDCRDEVADLVQCPTCVGPHDRWEEVGVKSDGELRYESFMGDWYSSHNAKLEDFHAFLEKYPYLGMAHDFGKEIREGVSDFRETTLSDEVFYRARRISNGRDYKLEDFLPPDPTTVPVGEGRFNHAGQSVMYFSEDKDGAAIECLSEGESRAWVQAFRIRGVDKILDLSDDEEWTDEDTPMLAFGLMHSGAVRRFADRANSWKPEYFVPRFIADCAREKGFKGIRFKSVRHWRTNLVLFSYDPTNVVPEGDPEIIRIEEWKHSEWMYRRKRDSQTVEVSPETAKHAEAADLIEP